ncbi:hypothetical protein [Allgaiera indica]|nr:hypothetical protein [Allgaiera indica]
MRTRCSDMARRPARVGATRTAHPTPPKAPSIARGWALKSAAVLLLLVAGCTSLPAPRSMPVARGSVVIEGPAGYCIDTKGSRDTTAGTFVLLGSCASISGVSTQPRPQAPAILTAAVSAGSSGAGIAGSEKRLARYFESRAGRAALSRSGKARTVTILGHYDGDGAFFLHLRDSSARPDPTVSWRVLFDLNGHIVTLSVVGLPGRPISARHSEALLRAFMAQVRAASPHPAPRKTTG